MSAVSHLLLLCAPQGAPPLRSNPATVVSKLNSPSHQKLSRLPKLRTVSNPSDTALVMACFDASGAHVCQMTARRWGDYAAFHGLDLFVLREMSPFWAHDARLAASWDKVAAAIELLTRRPYEWVLIIDGDSIPLRWRLTPSAFRAVAADASQRAAPHNYSIYVSQDVGHFGFAGPPIGPHNSGVILLRRDATALELLEYMQQHSTDKARQRWPRDQGAMNNWLSKPSRRESFCALQHGSTMMRVEPGEEEDTFACSPVSPAMITRRPINGALFVRTVCGAFRPLWVLSARGLRVAPLR